jgi:hypothetical protein
VVWTSKSTVQRAIDWNGPAEMPGLFGSAGVISMRVFGDRGQASRRCCRSHRILGFPAQTITSKRSTPLKSRTNGGVQDSDSITFREELEALKARLSLTVVYVLAKPPAGWTGEKGFINAEIFKRHLLPPYADHEYFICGPNVMMDAIEKALGRMNVPPLKYHSERYSFMWGDSRCAVCLPTD